MVELLDTCSGFSVRLTPAASASPLVTAVRRCPEPSVRGSGVSLLDQMSCSAKSHTDTLFPDTTTHFSSPHVNVRVLEKAAGQRRERHVVNASSTLLPAVVRPAVEDRAWLSSDHCAGPVLDLLGALGWAIVDTPQANVHCTSPDGCVYVGWLPEDTAAWMRDIVWQVRVAPADAAPWVQELGLDTPSEAVAGFLAALVANPSR